MHSDDEEKMHADDKENDILNRQLNGLPSGASHGSLFAYLLPWDIAVLVVSCASAIIAGALNPLLTVIYGQLAGAFQLFSRGSMSSAHLMSLVSKFTLYFVYLAIGEFVFIFIATFGFYHIGERIVRRLRLAYLESVVRQNMAFFDVLSAGEVTTRITSDMNLIQESITSKLSLSLTAAASFIAAFVIAFVQYWKLALILSSTILAMAITGVTGAACAVKYTKNSLQSYRSGASVAEETISSIRHVAAFGIQETLAQRYLTHVLDAEASSIKAGTIIAIMIGFMQAIPYLSYGLSFWQGSRFVISGDMSGSAVVTTTLAIVIGAFAIGRVTPNTQAFTSGIASASSILKAISRQSPQDPFSKNGTELGAVRGDLTFIGVSLVYPSRPDVTIFKDLDLEIPAGKTTAIVGASGCGKSSICGLVERFYEPTGGHIMLDGHDIQSLNLHWLRQQISYVGQDPILFNTTIFENIKYGLLDMQSNVSEDEMHKLVIESAIKANAHVFILALPDGYQTEVGERGAQLSGGQRQRIALARALIRDPPLLLLDEATSALDVKSERAVQRALESRSETRTTMIIAHRLSTIRNADKIIVMSKGCVVEQGQHDELMAREGVYFNLVGKQQGLENKRALYEFTPYSGANDSEDILLNSEEKKILVFESDSSQKSETHLIKKENSENPSDTSEKVKSPPISLLPLARMIVNLTRPERFIAFAGILCSVIGGLGTPVQSIFFAKLVEVLSFPTNSYNFRHYSSFWCLMYLVLGITTLAARLGQGVLFSYASEKLTRRARDRSFRSIIRQDIAFFDEKQNSTGMLTAFLSTGTVHLNSLGGAIFGSIISFTFTILGGVVLSLVVGWKLALVCSATIPVVAGCGWVRLKALAVFDDKLKKTQEESATYASEVVSAIRTVASLSLEARIRNHYDDILARQAAKAFRPSLQASALYAASQSCVFLCAALGFWYGGMLVANREYTIVQLFICFAALISGSQSAGAVFSFAPDISKAIRAGRDLKAHFDRKPEVDIWDTAGTPIENEKCAGSVQIDNVSFSYPTRPERLVLQNFSLSVQPGQFIALVGPSGCGKSTIVSLIERFYDPSSGVVSVDGKDISHLEVNDYRRLLSLVSQDTMLYQGTIWDNLTLGLPSTVSKEAVTQACSEANIYEFIMSLPEGFSTIVGARGGLLSGGQKQRIAIARALLRNPRILLLDEATSALDSESERLVQEALDTAAQHRTTIAIAHRLSSIKNADVIYVLDNGDVVESGSHAELMARQGIYFELVQTQKAETTGLE